MSDYLSRLRPAEGAVHRRKRVGRGIGSGHGKSAGRGTKGQKARETVRTGFEGGQTPLARRIPRLRGFKSISHKDYAIVNVSQLSVFEPDARVTPEALLERRIISDVKDGVKILGDGEIDRPLVVCAHKFSASAQEKIRNAGGEVQVLPLRGEQTQPAADAQAE